MRPPLVKLIRKSQCFGRLFPANPVAETFCKLIARSCVAEEKLQHILALGYTVEIIENGTVTVLTPSGVKDNGS